MSGNAAYLDESGRLTYMGYRAVKDAMTVAEWRRVQDKCRWEHMIPSYWWAATREGGGQEVDTAIYTADNMKITALAEAKK